MSAPWFMRSDWDGRAPGFHAFLVGISAYAHLRPPLPKGGLPPSDEALPAEHFGMRQLSSPALTAYRLAEMLREKASQFDPPLATCRLLLAPSDEEIAAEPALAAFRDTPPDHDNFIDFAEAWRKDASARPDGATFFYHAGHGLEQTSRAHILPLHNFASGKGSTFSHKAVNVSHLLDGMAASATQATMARTQLYFIDACRVADTEANKIHSTDTGNIWDYQAPPSEDERVLARFFAAQPGGTTAAAIGDTTLFGSALLKCLRGGAGVASVSSDPDSDYVITIGSLQTHLRRYIDEENRLAAANQSNNVQAVQGDKLLLRLDERPEVRVILTLDPLNAVGVAALSEVDVYDEPVRVLVPTEDRERYELVTRAGHLIVLAVTDPEHKEWRPRVRKPFVVLPPEASPQLSLRPAK